MSKSQNLPSFDLVSEETPEMRRKWMFLGTGKNVELEYFLPLSNPKNSDQESYLVWDVQSCMILYLNVFQCIVCLEYVLNSLRFCNTLEILGDGFLEMDGHWYSCLLSNDTYLII